MSRKGQERKHIYEMFRYQLLFSRLRERQMSDIKIKKAQNIDCQYFALFRDGLAPRLLFHETRRRDPALIRLNFNEISTGRE